MTLEVSPPPSVECRPVAPFDASDLAGTRLAFAMATAIPLGQPWREGLESHFRGGAVHIGWHRSAFLVFAELIDQDVHTRALQHNERFWELGDTFEIFLQPRGGTAYLELHVAPNNLRLQLRFSRPPDPSAGDAFPSALVTEPLFQSRTWLTPDGWSLLAEIPAASAGCASVPFLDTSWAFSFGRYDYTRGRNEPVLSCSSPHPVPAFHRPHEWGILRVCDTPC